MRTPALSIACGEIQTRNSVGINMKYFQYFTLFLYLMTGILQILHFNDNQYDGTDDLEQVAYYTNTPGTRGWSRLRDRTLAVKSRKSARKSAKLFK